MNLREEHHYQKLMDALESLELTEKNKKLAEQYLDETKRCGPVLLKAAEPQDFSRLDEKKQKKSREYAGYLQKRKRTEEVKAYVEFAAAVGGSTAYYVLADGLWMLKDLKEWLTREQETAIRAEALVWNSYALRERSLAELFETGRMDPKALQKAIQLCNHKYSNAKVLLTGILLFSCKTQSSERKEGILKKLFSAKEEKKESSLQEQVEYLENNLITALSGLFPDPQPTQEELKPLISFLQAQTEEELPEKAVTLIRGKRFHTYLLTLLTGTAFISIDHSGKFVNFIRLALEMDFEVALTACKEMAPTNGSWFTDHMELFTKELGRQSRRYLCWCINHKAVRALQKAAAKFPEAYRQLAKEGSTDDYFFLMKQAEVGNPGLYQEIAKNMENKLDFKLAHEMTSGLPSGSLEARDFLLGERKLEDLYPFVNAWRGLSYYRYPGYTVQDKLKKLMHKSPKLYSRGTVLMALAMRGNFLNNNFTFITKEKAFLRNKMEEEMDTLVQLFEEEGLSVVYQADALGAVYESSYNDKWKAAFMDEAVKALVKRRNDHVEQVHAGVREGTVLGRGICLRVLDSFAAEEQETILETALDSSKQVREVLSAICLGHPEWEGRMIEMLSSKKSQERELAILTLQGWGAEKYHQQLVGALEKEKSKKLKELLGGCLGVSTSDTDQASPAGQDMVTLLLKGGKARKVSWAFETPFSPVHTLQEEIAEEKYLQAILVAYADKTVPGISEEAKQLAASLKEEELNRFAAELLGKWLESGAEAKKKWVLYAAACHGGEKMVPIFWKNIQEWAQNSRGALAAEAVKALVFNGSSQALMQVDQIARKFKHRQVKTAALQALENAAGELGITRQELEDRIVPNLGFDEEMKRTFDYGARSFQVYLTPSLELEILDEEGKLLKNLPAPGKKDEEEKAKAAYEEFKQFKKQLKTVTTNQKQRLEYALSAERLWSSESWTELFVKNPVMHQFAIGLIWGIYEEGRLTKSFRYMEDGSFTTCDEEELELPEGASIGLVHPIELEEEELKNWKEQLSDYEITQPVEQLNRPVYRITEEEKGAAELTRFGGKLLNGLSLSGKLQGMGWYKGSTGDAGMYFTFYREDGKWGAELEFSGCYVADENEEITVFGLNFYRAGTVKRGSYVYDKIEEQNHYKPDQVQPRYFSEIVYQLTRATASSKEQLPYPECKDRR